MERLKTPPPPAPGLLATWNGSNFVESPSIFSEAVNFFIQIVSVEKRRKKAEKLAAEKLVNTTEIEADDLTKCSKEELIKEINQLRKELNDEKVKRNLWDGKLSTIMLVNREAHNL